MGVHYRLILSGCLIAAFILCVFALSTGAQQSPMENSPTATKAVSAADKACLECHGAKGRNPVGDIGITKHGTAADSRTPGCGACHGQSTAHINNPEAAKSDIQYHAKSSMPPAKRNGQCLTCHRGAHP